jgi:putative tricarboxylic transport membrane protein
MGSMTRDTPGLIAAACLAAFGIYVIYGASNLAYVAEVGPGPGFFPFWIGLGLVCFASLQIFSSLSAPRLPSQHRYQNWQDGGRALTAWLALAVSIALFRWIGFALCFVLLTIFLLAVLDRRSALLACGIGLGLAMIFHLVFVIALGISLPIGPWGF